MSNGNLQIFKNNELGLEIRTIVNEDGSISVNAEEQLGDLVLLPLPQVATKS